MGRFRRLLPLSSSLSLSLPPHLSLPHSLSLGHTDSLTLSYTQCVWRAAAHAVPLRPVRPRGYVAHVAPCGERVSKRERVRMCVRQSRPHKSVGSEGRRGRWGTPTMYTAPRVDWLRKYGVRSGFRAGGFRGEEEPPNLSDTTFCLMSFKKSTPPPNRDLMFQLVIVNDKLTILWGLTF